MRPAEGRLHITALCKHLITAVTIDLHDAFEAGEIANWPLSLALGRIDVSDARRVSAACAVAGMVLFLSVKREGASRRSPWLTLPPSLRNEPPTYLCCPCGQWRSGPSSR
jgi:hypothetical protein